MPEIVNDNELSQLFYQLILNLKVNCNVVTFSGKDILNDTHFMDQIFDRGTL